MGEGMRTVQLCTERVRTLFGLVVSIPSSFPGMHEAFRDSIVASIPACHAGDPGSIPGRGAASLV